jgi:hypothetical protein
MRIVPISIANRAAGDRPRVVPNHVEVPDTLEDMKGNGGLDAYAI